jgi:hypothetical protein
LKLLAKQKYLNSLLLSPIFGITSNNQSLPCSSMDMVPAAEAADQEGIGGTDLTENALHPSAVLVHL